MKNRQLLVTVAVFMVLCLTIGVTQAQDKSFGASRFDVDMTVEEGGSLLVKETVVFDFASGPFTFVFRELPLDHTDGISILEATVDGLVYPIGANPEQAEISMGNPMRITWHLKPTSSSSHIVTLTYRAYGVVRQEKGSDALHWQALPDEYEYFIGESETIVHYPAYTSLIADPALLAGTAVINQSPNQVTFTAQNLQPNSPLVLQMDFKEGSLISAPPDWQVEQQAAAERQATQISQTPLLDRLSHLCFWIGVDYDGSLLPEARIANSKKQSDRDDPTLRLATGYGWRFAKHRPELESRPRHDV